MKKILMTLILLSTTALAGGHAAPLGGPPIGGQRDAHGCRSAAGQSWSVLRRECVQPWNVADVRLTDPRHPQRAVYILFSRNGRRAELLGEQRLLRREGTGYVSADGLTRLEKIGQNWNLKMEKEAPIGGEQDAHGCLPSTGASWSALRGECVQVFNVADIHLPDPGNPNLSVFVLLSPDRQRAELFGLGYRGGVMLSQTPAGYVSVDGKVRLEHVGSGWALR